LSESGRLAASCWEAIPAHFPRVELDDWVLMPNHLHGILVIQPPDPKIKVIKNADVPDRPAVVGAQHAAPPIRLLNQGAFLPRSPTPRLKVAAGSLGAIMGSFKAASTREVNRLCGFQGPSIWQRNYHDHVIRDTDELNRIRQYIRDNPREWATDSENPAVIPEDGF
jgi:putative transposase